MEGIRTVEVGGAKGNGRGVFDFQVELRRRREDSVSRRRVGECVAGPNRSV